MTEILEYITLNYTWFLGGAIIILLAVIGNYADKTNFGQGKIKKSEDSEPANLELAKKGLDDYIKDSSMEKEVNGSDGANNKDERLKGKLENIENNANNQILNSNEDLLINNKLEKNKEVKQENSIDKSKSFEEEFNNFDKEFNSILSKKETISGDLLDDIENLSIDDDENIKSYNNDIPDLDDVELPKIKNLKSQSEDIWKF